MSDIIVIAVIAAALSIATGIALASRYRSESLLAEVESLRADNEALRGSRDAWKCIADLADADNRMLRRALEEISTTGRFVHPQDPLEMYIYLGRLAHRALNPEESEESAA